MTVTLIDLSNNNVAAPTLTMKNAGVDAMWHKVTEGDSFVDRYWPVRAGSFRKAGLRVGGYHFARPGRSTPEAQAHHFCRYLGGIGRRDLRPVLDFETNDGHLTPSELALWARKFTREVFKLTGVGPMFYSYTSFIKDMGLEVPIGYGLWLADYGPNDGREHPYTVPAPWKKAHAHQYTSNGKLNGVPGNVDLSSAAKLRPLLARPVAGLL